MLDIVPVSAGGINEALCPGSGENNIPAIVNCEERSRQHPPLLISGQGHAATPPVAITPQTKKNITILCTRRT